MASVEQGARLVKDTGRIIGEVRGSVEEVNELIGIIAVASREQSAGVDGVSKALVRLEGATQQTAAVVHQTATSAATFKDEAERLFGLVSRFRLDEESAPAAREAHRRDPPRAPKAVPRSMEVRRLGAAGKLETTVHSGSKPTVRP